MTFSVRKPPARATVRDYLNEERGLGLSYDWLQRYFRLRALGLLMPLLDLAADGRYWVADDPISRWDSKHLETAREIKAKIEELERRIANEKRTESDAA